MGERADLAVEPLFGLGKLQIGLLHPLVAAAVRVMASFFRHIRAVFRDLFQAICVWHSRAFSDYLQFAQHTFAIFVPMSGSGHSKKTGGN